MQSFHLGLSNQNQVPNYTVKESDPYWFLNKRGGLVVLGLV